jgi:hypothetical protein
MQDELITIPRQALMNLLANHNPWISPADRALMVRILEKQAADTLAAQ